MEKISDIQKILTGWEFVLIRVYYYVPDYTKIINEFIWQTIDKPYEYPRIRKFLNYWKNNIEAVIKEIEIERSTKLLSYRKVEKIFDINKLI